MTCGIICRLDSDGCSPYTELARIRAFVDSLPGRPVEEKPDWVDKAARGFLIFLCVINVPVLIAAALLAEFVL